jgi:hypothetical protein
VVDVEVVHCYHWEILHVQILSELLGEIRLPNRWQSLDEYQFGVFIEPLRRMVKEGMHVPIALL